MERNYKLYGVEDPQPAWFSYVSKWIRLLCIAVAIVVSAVAYVKLGSIKGSGVAVTVIFAIYIAPVYLLATLLAIAHRKYRFAHSLPKKDLPLYISLLKRRALILIIILCIVVIFACTLFISDHKTGGKGLF